MAVFLFVGITTIRAADSDVDSSFVSRLVGGTNSEFIGVESVALQADGKMIVGGTFKSFASRLQSGIGRINADGSPDYIFNPNVNNSVYAVAVQADGKILIGGEFSSVGGQARTRLARLNADGSLDQTFGDLNVNARVYTIILQTDGKILIGGEFDGVAGQTQSRVARLNPNGTLDTNFANPNLGGTVYALAVQADGKIFVGGNNIFVIGSQYRYFGRLNANGTADASFPDVVGVGDVRKIKIQPNGKIMISGSFAFIGPSGNTVNRKAIARLNPDGSNDTAFGNVSEISASTIYDFVVLPDGRIIIGGTFSYQSFTRNGLARISSNGTLDTTYDPNLDNQVRSLVLQSDGKLIVGGYFRFIGGQGRRNFVRLNPDASLDLFPKDITLDSTTSQRGWVRAITTQPDGKILLGGYFASAGGRTRRGVVRVNPDSTIDTSFTDPGIYSFFYTSVSAIVVQPDGKILVGGDFDFAGGQPRKHLVRLNADGTPDAAFNPEISDVVYSVALQPDGKILIGGSFYEVNGQQRSRMARLNTNGTLDASFNRGSDFAVPYSMALLPDGKIIAPGSQSGVTGALLRYNTDGSRDASFNGPDLSGSNVVKVLRQPDGKLLIGGPFSTVNGQARRHVARLNPDGTLDTTLQNTSNAFGSVFDLALQTDGKIIIAGDFTPIAGQTDRRYLARLNADGSYDITFNPLPDNNVYVAAMQTDGKILAGGDFQEVGGVTQDYITRLLGSATVNPCAPAAINFGQTINGNLGANGCNAFNSESDYVSLNKVTKNRNVIGNSALLVFFSDYYSFNATAGQQIAISMSSGVFDTYLYLLNSSGAVIAENDDIVPGNTNSRIPATGFFTVPATGTYTIRASSYNENAIGAYTLSLSVNNSQPLTRAPFDYDGDGKTDISIFRPGPGEWWFLRSSDNGNRAFQFGQSSDKLVPADYTGDGKTDIAFWRPSSGEWFILRSEDFSFYAFPFGATGDIPVPADYDGDGKADAAVFRPSNLTWYINKSSGGTQITTFGAPGDAPTVADYDGDGKADIAIFRPNAPNGAEWWILRSASNSVYAAQFGNSSDKAVQGDYTGDGKADIAIYRPSDGTWSILRSEDFSFYGFPFGASGDVPVPGDYDGDGRFDAGVYRPSTTNWFIQRSTAGTLIQQFGTTGDMPTPNVFVP
jgi:uncharacterized delta-60 repeat protein